MNATYYLNQIPANFYNVPDSYYNDGIEIPDYDILDEIQYINGYYDN